MSGHQREAWSMRQWLWQTEKHTRIRCHLTLTMLIWLCNLCNQITKTSLSALCERALHKIHVVFFTTRMKWLRNLSSRWWDGGYIWYCCRNILSMWLQFWLKLESHPAACIPTLRPSTKPVHYNQWIPRPEPHPLSLSLVESHPMSSQENTELTISHYDCTLHRKWLSARF